MSESTTNRPSTGTDPGMAHGIEAPEPWAGWETRLCLWSLALGIGGLVVLAVLVHSFLL